MGQVCDVYILAIATLYSFKKILFGYLIYKFYNEHICFCSSLSNHMSDIYTPFVAIFL